MKKILLVSAATFLIGAGIYLNIRMNKSFFMSDLTLANIEAAANLLPTPETGGGIITMSCLIKGYTSSSQFHYKCADGTASDRIYQCGQYERIKPLGWNDHYGLCYIPVEDPGLILN